MKNLDIAPKRSTAFKTWERKLWLLLLTNVWEVVAILIGLWYVFFYTDYPILDKLFALCQFMQAVIPHENHTVFDNVYVKMKSLNSILGMLPIIFRTH